MSPCFSPLRLLRSAPFLVSAALVAGCGSRKEDLRASAPPMVELEPLAPVKPPALDPAASIEAVAPKPLAPPEPGIPSSWERTARAVVAGVQEQLVHRGHAPGYPDGLYGPQTKEAVESFQRTAALPISGIANRATLVALFDEPAPTKDEDIELTSGEDAQPAVPDEDGALGTTTIATIALGIAVAFGAGRASKAAVRRPVARSR